MLIYLIKHDITKNVYRFGKCDYSILAQLLSSTDLYLVYKCEEEDFTNIDRQFRDRFIRIDQDSNSTIHCFIGNVHQMLKVIHLYFSLQTNPTQDNLKLYTNLIQFDSETLLNIDDFTFYSKNRRIPKYPSSMTSHLSFKFSGKEELVFGRLQENDYQGFQYITFFEKKKCLIHFIVKSHLRDPEFSLHKFINMFFSNKCQNQPI